MENLYLLPQVIQNLEQHKDSLRLKKLSFYICHQVWENDRTKIDNADWQSLLQELVSKKPNFISLNKYIYGMAKTTNKPKQYLLLADILIAQLEKIYFIEEDVTVACLANFQEDLTSQEMPNQPEVVKPYDLYKIRAEIIGNINPLRAKILLFSAIYEQFNFSSQDWAMLKTQQFDELIQNLVDSYPTFTDLVSKLEITAGIMREIDENLKVARVISQALKPFYPAVFI
ncbi:MAG: hypothetical protein KME01_01410 [Chroococcus sp. CMT-3BRIN-NPC107]|jgi:hypothetical protein|nr:hypothetical protein [Chroococcus sp. CMT-3BRIN-NPC107]